MTVSPIGRIGPDTGKIIPIEPIGARPQDKKSAEQKTENGETFAEVFARMSAPLKK